MTTENAREAIPLSALPYVARRVRRGRAVVAVASEVGISSTVWSRVEKGDPVSLNSLILLARYMGCIIAIQPTDQIQDGEDEGELEITEAVELPPAEEDDLEEDVLGPEELTEAKEAAWEASDEPEGEPGARE